MIKSANGTLHLGANVGKPFKCCSIHFDFCAAHGLVATFFGIAWHLTYMRQVRVKKKPRRAQASKYAGASQLEMVH
jgi:hypothetical protein